MSAELTFDSAWGLSRFDRSALYRTRAFTLAYPEIVATVSPQSLSASPRPIWETPPPESHTLGDTLPSEAELQGMRGEVLL